MRIARLARAVLLIGASALPAACATTSYSRSAVEALPSGVKGKAGGNASLELAGLKLRIETLDRVTRKQEAPQLALRILFDPRELGYSFDPTQVVVRDAEGTRLLPRAAGPGVFNTTTGACAGAERTDAPRYHSVMHGSCFELGYDVVLGPDARLELEVGGLALGTKRLDSVTLRLVRRNGTSIDRVYWLEALGYALAPLGY